MLAAARGCVGARFRPQGRDPAFGLDCVGLVLVALRAGGVEVAPGGYAMRSGDAARVTREIAAAGLVRVDAPAPGDVVLFESGPGQLHLGVASEVGVIHADAGLRRVVERRGWPWRVVGVWGVGDSELPT